MMNWKSMLRTILCVLLLATVAATFGACSPSTTEGDQSAQNQNDVSIFAVEYRNTVIELGAKADSVLSRLGKPRDEQFVASCGEGVGDQWMYDYGSVILYTVKDGKNETVDAVVLRDDSAETVDGISIGATAKEMTEAYGEATSDGQKRRYQKDGKTLEFRLDESQKIVAAELRVES